MNRRDFVSRQLATGLVLGAPALLAHAQGAPQEGRDFRRVAEPLAMPAGKVQVVEFFGYWCPHCNAFEPALESWVRQLPADKVAFTRIPVAFQAWHENYQKLYFAIEALGQLDKLHTSVFKWIHVDKKRLDKDDEIRAWAAASGADATRILDAMKSFGIAGKLAKARQLAQGYGIDGVPTIGVHGRWMTSPSISGSPDRALSVTNQLIAQVKA